MTKTGDDAEPISPIPGRVSRCLRDLQQRSRHHAALDLPDALTAAPEFAARQRLAKYKLGQIKKAAQSARPLMYC